MEVKKFEENRWLHQDQPLSFRHKAATKLVKKGPVLDLGCGDGLLLRMLRDQKNILGEGVDLSEEAVRKCNAKGTKASAADLTELPLKFRDRQFATVIMLDVLEHLYYPDNLIREARRLASDYLVIGVPNFNSLPARLQMVFGKIPENNKPKKGHVYWFNYQILKMMLKKHNLILEDLEVSSFWENKFFLGWLIKKMTRTWPSLWALSFVTRVRVCELGKSSPKDSC